VFDRYHADNEAVSLADLKNATKIITQVRQLAGISCVIHGMITIIMVIAAQVIGLLNE